MVIINTKKTSMKEIANALDVSIVSVSKAINNKPGVSEPLRKKILLTAYEMGYITTKRELSGAILKMAYISPKRYFFESEQFYTQILYHLNEICARDNIILSLYIISPDDEQRLLIPPMISGDHFDGIFIGGEMSDQYIYSLSNLGIPAVCIDFYKPGMEMDCIVVDNFYASYNATMHLIRKGHSKIGFVGNQMQTTSILDRFFGYRKALYQYELEYRDEWHLIYPDKLAIPTECPTAFVCHNDATAMAFISHLNSLGLCVPGDISIASFDNLDIGENSVTPITSVDINRAAFADKAFSQLISRINESKRPYQRVIIDIKLIEKESVKEINAGQKDS